MFRSAVPWFGVALVACSNDAKLAELEARQSELQASVSTTTASIADMRQQLEAMGVIAPEGGKPKGKAGGTSSTGKAKGGKIGHPLPKDDVTATLAFQVQRAGKPPVFPPLPPPERSETACGWKYTVKELQPISDFQLNSNGLGKPGPLRLLSNGTPLAPHAAPADYEGRCGGAFRHAGYLILFSPADDPDATPTQTWSIDLDDRVPMPRGDDGRPMYWVYPGTQLTITTQGAWDPAWGEAELDLVPRVLGTGNWTVTVGGAPLDIPAEKDAPHLHQAIPQDGGPFTLTLASPADGPYLVLETLTLGNAEHAAVLTSEAAFRAAQR